MKILKIRNVHQALPDGIDLLIRNGYERNSRYGRVLKIDGPVVTQYRNPWERGIFWSTRDFNPFFNLFEALWLLNGRDDVYFMKNLAKKMEEFSDDGKTFHGSYGRRWRSWFKIDQIQIIIDALKKNPDDRRCVLQMWDATKDLGKIGKDFPCNTHVYFSVNNEGQLDMTVCCRSNDVIYGAYNTNSTCFSILQEYVAAAIERPMGRYWQFSNDYHAYLSVLEPMRALADRASDPHRIADNPYEIEDVSWTPVIDLPIAEWDVDLKLWLTDPYKVGLRSNFFKRVATPMWAAHKAYKAKEYDEAIKIVDSQMLDKGDWKIATKEWLQRRKSNWEKNRDNDKPS